MGTGIWHLAQTFVRSLRSTGTTHGVALWKRRWIGPLVLTALITIVHFSIDPRHMFWHDLLRRAYYAPIIWVVYQSGLRGGAISSIAVSAVFLIHLLTGWRHHLGSQMDQVYDIVGYLAVGFGVGFVVDRAREAAVAVAQREWDVSLRGVISAAIHELSKPKAAIRKMGSELAAHSQRGMWEYSIGLRLARASDQIDGLRRDLAGIAKILSSNSIITKPFDWALRFSKDQHLGGQFGLMAVKPDNENPPPAVWPISPAILDEVTRCLLEDVNGNGKADEIIDLTVAGRDGKLIIECSKPVRRRPWSGSGPEPKVRQSTHKRGWVRMKLLELTSSRYNGTLEQFDDQNRQGFRLQLIKPRLRLSGESVRYKRHTPARGVQESNIACMERARRRSRRASLTQ